MFAKSERPDAAGQATLQVESSVGKKLVEWAEKVARQYGSEKEAFPSGSYVAFDGRDYVGRMMNLANLLRALDEDLRPYPDLQVFQKLEQGGEVKVVQVYDRKALRK